MEVLIIESEMTMVKTIQKARELHTCESKLDKLHNRLENYLLRHYSLSRQVEFEKFQHVAKLQIDDSFIRSLRRYIVGI
jgi:hypothetical protein